MVDEDGVVTAVGNGTAGVTVSSGGQSASAMVTVEQEVAEVVLTPAADTLVAVGDTVRLTAEARDANGHVVAGAELAWSSDDEAVVMVDEDGVVTAVGNGTAGVTVSSGGQSASAMVTVEQQLAEVVLTPAADTLVALGDTVRISLEATDANGNAMTVTDFDWSSGDELVATVDSSGLVTAVADGSATITATSGSASASAELTVEQLAVEMRLSPDADTLGAPGGTLHLMAEAEDANGHLLGHPRFTWTSSDVTVAAVDESGLVTAVAEGEAEVTAVEATAGLTRSAVLFVVEPSMELLMMYETLDGSGWTNAANWGTDQPLDTWYGITTDSEGRITEINLSNNGLAGAIPPEIGRLEHLEVLDLSGNALSEAAADDPGPLGPALDLSADLAFSPVPPRPEQLERRVAYAAGQSPGIDPWPCYLNWSRLTSGTGVTSVIPPELGSLPNLRVLDLSKNSLTGTIPPELGNLENLEILDLGFNTLEGPIPPELGQLDNLEALSACYNRQWDPSVGWVSGLTGAIPAELGGLANLEVLDLTSNLLQGQISTAFLGNNLEILSLGGNWLTGVIPAELGNLASLEILNLSSIGLRGEIPAELGNLGSLEILYLGGNHLTGAIPAELGNLANLEVLYLGGNQLTGALPAELGNLASLEILHLASNQLTGVIPAGLGNLGNLRQLQLFRNQLTGAIPAELGNLASLEVLDLLFNELTGTIPAELGNLANLEILDLGGNMLTGTIPTELADLGNLRRLQLSGELTGAIPAELGNLANLETLSLVASELTGAIPVELGNLGSLERLHLSNNQLTGAIPAELGNLGNLIWLYLSDNQLTGAIPAELGNLGNLESLYLRDNQLAGALPAELGNLGSLELLYLDRNRLTGALPAELGNLGNLESLFLSNNQLTGAIPREFINIPLRVFYWYNTNLCAPADGVFQNWLASIVSKRGGENCASASRSRD